MGTYDLYKFEEQPLYVIADIHGSLNLLKPYIKNKGLSECIIIIAGDIGLGFKPLEAYLEELALLNKYLLLRKITLLMVRGNHDDPSYFNEKKINLSNVKCLTDYSVISIFLKDDEEMIGLPKYNILCVGGATSIDRTYRNELYNKRKLTFIETHPWIMDKSDIDKFVYPSYWSDELPVFKEDILNDIKNDGLMIEHVITHTCPKFCFPINKNNITYWLSIDEDLSDTIDKERDVMSLIYDKLLTDNHILRSWTYGHYHFHNKESIKNVIFTALMNCDASFDVVEIDKKNDFIEN